MRLTVQNIIFGTKSMHVSNNSASKVDHFIQLGPGHTSMMICLSESQ